MILRKNLLGTDLTNENELTTCDATTFTAAEYGTTGPEIREHNSEPPSSAPKTDARKPDATLTDTPRISGGLPRVIGIRKTRPRAQVS